ncbi:hypothetical protein D1007_26510 [Hordeum vulgare]|nr:hypothetical protein D1007_26510 [Hordeum vulgare]
MEVQCAVTLTTSVSSIVSVLLDCCRRWVRADASACMALFCAAGWVACRSEGWEGKPNPNPHSSSSPAREGKPPAPSSSRRHGSPGHRLAPAQAAAAHAPPAPAPAPPAQTAAAPAPLAPATVADVVAATHVGAKWRRAGLAPPPPAPAAAAPAPATVQPAPAKKSRPKVSSRGPRGASSKATGASPKRKKVTARKKPAPPVVAVAEPPSAAHEVFEEMANPTSFMDLLQDAEVDLGAPPLEPFGEEVGEDEEDEGDDEEEVAEIGEEAFTAASRPHARSTNYTEAEDILLVRAWASVGMDATTDTDQTVTDRFKAGGI